MLRRKRQKQIMICKLGERKGYAPWLTGAWLVMSAGRKQENKEPKEASRFR